MKHKFATFAFFCFFLSTAVSAQEPSLKLWPNDEDGKGKVKLTQYIAKENSKSPAIIVCPGGSYFWLDKQNEGHEVARWLQSQGISAFVLEYRVGGKFNFASWTRPLYGGGNRYPAMLQDVQMAIHYLRKNHVELDINPEKVGVMGFSAGGHLSMLSAEQYSPILLQNEGIEVTESLRPDFVVPIYPVVTLKDNRYAHKRSSRGILGETRLSDKKLRHLLSLEDNVPEDCCPVFLLNALDDHIVHYMNSVLLDSALTAKCINHLYIQNPVGGHGFGCKVINSEEHSLDWKPLFIQWLEAIFD